LANHRKKGSAAKKTTMKKASGRPPANEASGRMEDILGIAAQAFLDEGFDRTSVGAIARLAGASKETLYARFATKEELFEAVITRKAEILLEKFSRVLIPGKKIDKLLESYGLSLLNFMLSADMQRLSRTVVSAAPHFPELAERFWKLCPGREQQQLANYLQAESAAGRLNGLNSRKAAELFFSLCLGQFLLHAQLLVRKRPSTAERRAHIQEVVRMFLAAYRE
jgi:TetR/AcrR family transcriptional regulator, mexJK operon transcriptional repressor